MVASKLGMLLFRRIPLFTQPEAVANSRKAFQKELAAPSIRWMPPPNDADYSIRWRNIKRLFTVTVPTEQPPRLR
jgi:putative transposase